MIKINLLPWREERHKHRERAFYKMLVGCVVLTILVMGFVHLYMREGVKYQEARNRFLAGEVARLTRQAKEAGRLEMLQKQLAERFATIQKLSRERYAVVHLLDELVKSVPDGIFLSEAERKGEYLFLKGNAESNTRVSQFLRNLANSAWFCPPVLTNIEAEENNLLGFSLTVKQHEPQLK